MTLEENLFLNIIKNTPLISIDLIIRNKENLILLGKRKNQPAKGYWFVPGSRIKKEERIKTAFTEITKEEIKTSLGLDSAKLIGVYEHLYTENALEVDGVTTHYIVLAVEILIDKEVDLSPNDQHEEFRWWTKENLLANSEVHEYTKAYFDDSNLTKVMTC